MERIRGVSNNSAGLVRVCFGSYASRATAMGGSAILDAAANLKDVIRTAAGRLFGCAPGEIVIDDGFRAVSAGAKSRTLSELAPEGLEAEGTFVNSKRTYSYG